MDNNDIELKKAKIRERYKGNASVHALKERRSGPLYNDRSGDSEGKKAAV